MISRSCMAATKCVNTRFKIVAVTVLFAVLIILDPFNQSRIVKSCEQRIRAASPFLSTKPQHEISRGLRELDPEIFEVIPRYFLPEYRNPCFYKNGSNELYCLPYFYIVGMAKCGTTDVWDKIVAHPDVIDVPKEPHWWGLRRFRTDAVNLYPDKMAEVLKMSESTPVTSINFYLNWFKKLAVPLVESFSEEGFHQKVFGDASVSTATGISNRWRKQNSEASESSFVTADLLHAVQPDAKIIIMIRNTTRWAWSWYHYSVVGASSKKFGSTMSHLIDCVNKCLASHTERFCAYSDSCDRQGHHPLRNIHIGVFHWFIKDWIRTYGRDRIMIIPLEDWQLKKREVYMQILQYLELRSLTSEEMDAILTRKTKNSYSQRKFDISPDTLMELQAFFSPHNQQLSKLLHDDRYNMYI